MPAELVAAAALVVALVLYVLLGGADFGGGVWDLLASGPRREAQRELIEHAIGPIWEANHVWLILAVVILFTAFPPAFAALSIAFHVPLTLLLIGIVFRGATFAFRSFDPDRHAFRFGFQVASLLAPVLLGVVVGAIASGRVTVRDGVVTGGFFAPWLAPFPIAVGLLTLALCALLAATYLTNETDDPALAGDFRRRALAAGAAVVVLAVAALALAGTGAPRVRARLTGSAWSVPFLIAAALVATGALAALVRRSYRVARALAAAETALVLAGWAAAQYPYLVGGDLTITAAAAPARTVRLLLTGLFAGLPVLLPSLWALFRVFKAGQVTSRTRCYPPTDRS